MFVLVIHAGYAFSLALTLGVSKGVCVAATLTEGTELAVPTFEPNFFLIHLSILNHY